MKKLLFPLAMLAMFFVACSPEDGNKDDKKDDGGAKAPATYTQKALLEYFSGAWCGWCPDGKLYAENFVETYGDNFYYVVVHKGDAMEIAEGAKINDAYNSAGYPTGMISRIGKTTKSRGDWEKDLISVYDQDAKMGLAIDASEDDGDVTKVKVKVGIGESAPLGENFKVIVYAVADKVTSEGDGFDQVNYFYQNPNYTSHPYYNQADYYKTASNGSKVFYIKGYEHTNVLIDVVTPTFYGEKIENINPGDLNEFTYDYGKTEWEIISDVHFIAFIYRSDVGADLVMNAQKVAKGGVKDFD